MNLRTGGKSQSGSPCRSPRGCFKTFGTFADAALVNTPPNTARKSGGRKASRSSFQPSPFLLSFTSPHSPSTCLILRMSTSPRHPKNMTLPHWYVLRTILPFPLNRPLIFGEALRPGRHNHRLHGCHCEVLAPAGEGDWRRSKL